MVFLFKSITYLNHTMFIKSPAMPGFFSNPPINRYCKKQYLSFSQTYAVLDKFTKFLFRIFNNFPANLQTELKSIFFIISSLAKDLI